MNDTTTTITTAVGFENTTGTATVGYVSPDWSTYTPYAPQTCYPIQPWGGWYPWVNPWPYIPPPQVVTQQIVIPRGLTEAEMDDLADRVAKKILAAKKGK